MIEVGEYCRTKGGHIHKVTRIDDNELVYWGKIQCGWSLEQLEDIIVKHSKNIIDLIEVGDYVNGKEIIIIDNRIGGLEKSVIYGYEYKDESRLWNIYQEDIKSIVTKEQFKSIEYRLED